MELPKINEDLRNFFLPKKYVAPEPEAAPEVSLDKYTAHEWQIQRGP